MAGSEINTDAATRRNVQVQYAINTPTDAVRMLHIIMPIPDKLSGIGQFLKAHFY